MKGASILLVEDSDTQALQFRLLLEREGVTVDRVASAEAGLDRLNASRPHLLVVDWQLPGMNGDELVRLVRQNQRTATLPIMLLTDAGTPDVERHGLDSGADAYVAKSVARDVLVARLRALLRQRRTPADQGSAGFRQPTLLVVEGDPTRRAALDRTLRGDGYVVDHATADAAEPHVTAAVDGVLVGLDATQDGLGLIRRLDAMREREDARFGIVALGDEGQRAAGFEAGADEVLPHDDADEMLRARVRALVRRKLARDEEAARLAETRAREQALARARAEADAAEALAEANANLAAANRQLRETQGQLVQAAKMASLGELVAGIAHEINNPLAFILQHRETVARLVAAGDDASLTRAGERLETMRTGLGRIQELVVKLRRFSRLDEGVVQPIDVPRAIDEVIALLAPKLGKGIAVTTDYGAPYLLVTSPALVNQVVMNILANAADAVPVDDGRIAIATDVLDGRYRIMIGDNGPGIAEERRGRVFEPFFTTKDVGAGTGLGLAIAYGVVRTQGGTITIGQSNAGGALFTIALPCDTGA